MNTAQLTLDDIWSLFKETNRMMKAMSQETDRRFQETNQQFKETDKKIKKVSDDIGKLGNRLGEYVEEIVRPAAVRLFKERGVNVHEVHQNIKSQRVTNGVKEGI